MYEEITSDEMSELLSTELNEVAAMKSDPFIIAVTKEKTKMRMLGDTIQYPYTKYQVSGQNEWACRLTPIEELPSDIKHIYRIDPGLTNIYATEKGLLTGVQACIFSVNGKSGVVTVNGMSSMLFKNTRPNTPTSPHNTGKSFDVKLAGRMKSDGGSYDHMACAYLCLYAVEAGSTRVYFADQTVIDAVNKATGKSVCEFRADHANHVHMHNYS